MSTKQTKGVDQTGLNLIRIVIGSYFMALSLDLLTGFDPAALFAVPLPAAAADILGSTLLLCLSGAFMAGVQLRLVALSLALLIISSSLVQNFVTVRADSISAFWRDLVLAVAVLLTYLTLGRRELRRASVLAHRARLRRAEAQARVSPRRINAEIQGKRPVQKEIRQALASRVRKNRVTPDLDDMDCTNIFATL